MKKLAMDDLQHTIDGFKTELLLARLHDLQETADQFKLYAVQAESLNLQATSIVPVIVVTDPSDSFALNMDQGASVMGRYDNLFNTIHLYPINMMDHLHDNDLENRFADMFLYALKHEEGHAKQRQELGVEKFIRLGGEVQEKYAHAYAQKATGFTPETFRMNTERD